MSEDERKADSFGETFKDEAEDPELFGTLRRVQVGRNMQNRPGTGNATSSEPPADLFHRISGPRNPMNFDMGAEGRQNAVRSSENVHQSAEYFFSQRTSNKRNVSNTDDSISGCSVWNKKMLYSEINANENSCQPLDLSIRGASYKTDGIRDGEIGSCRKTQSSTSASSTECSSSAFSSSENSKKKGKKYVCDVCKKGFSRLYGLKRHMEVHTGNKQHVCNICQKAFYQSSNLYSHLRIHAAESFRVQSSPSSLFLSLMSQRSHAFSHH
ncbi:hypothetical protein CDAR_552011 [Caerostris darwini]|uniref:C2H2-type domain-containing protein n=1 Tax=Caerostris darwini TaxID=1538125 RepID=A0AAV4PG85_9ARAC|nr:hypothetical protein CDAR_552011 [Caerostris darwini]